MALTLPLALSAPAAADTFSATTATAKPRVSTATLYGDVNTGGQQSRYFFQYGTTSSYSSSSQSAILPAAQSGTALVEAQIGDLAPNTTYHFRLVAEPISDSGPGTETYGADATFTTEPEHLQLDRWVMRVQHREGAVRVSCESSSTCNGLVTLTAAPASGKRRGPTCSTSVVSVDAWATATIPATLGRRCLRMLRRNPRHWLHAVAQVTLTSPQQGFQRRVFLHLIVGHATRRAPARRAA